MSDTNTFQAILRPAEIEAQALADALHQAALFGHTQLFDRRGGVDTEVEGTALVLSQDDGQRIQLDERGGILIQTLLSDTRRERRDYGFPALIEETVLARIQAVLGYAAWLLDHVDPTQRLTHVVIVARIEAGEHMAWRTQREQDESPNSGTIGWGREDKPPVTVESPVPRCASARPVTWTS